MLTRLVFRNFRNYERLRLEVERPLNLLVGANGQGKTSVLEGVFYLSMLRSFRTNRVQAMRRVGTQGFYVGAEWRGADEWPRRLEVDYESKRVLRLDGSPVRKASEFIRRLNAVAFTPEDVSIIKGNSGTRRTFFDMLIAMLEEGYLQALVFYQKALKSRNAILRSGSTDARLFDSYESVMVENGALIVKRRAAVATLVADHMRSLIEKIGKQTRAFRIDYRHQPDVDDVESFSKRLRDERDRDRLRGYSGTGPQMDEFVFVLDDKSARNYASTGQCRLLSLCLKMAKMNILLDDDLSKVVVLVDDVTGELDAATRDAFFGVTRRAGQMFFTFTESPCEDWFGDADVFDVADGAVIRRGE